MISLNLGVFKEPKGFMKLLQILFIIISLASICSFSTSITVNVTPPVSSTAINATLSSFYPFGQQQISVQPKTVANVTFDFESSSQFTVFVCSVSFIYCICALAIYIVFDDFLYRDPKIRKADFVIEAVLSFLCLVIAIAWSDVVSKLSGRTSRDAFCNAIKKDINCTIISQQPFSGAYIGIITCFTTFFLMLSGLWFLWKETAWFQKPAASAYNPEETPRVDTPQGDRPYY